MPTRAETLLQAATWLKWIRDDALDGRPGVPANTDEINAVIQDLEQLAAEAQEDKHSEISDRSMDVFAYRLGRSGGRVELRGPFENEQAARAWVAKHCEQQRARFPRSRHLLEPADYLYGTRDTFPWEPARSQPET
jgi:hypothetical protein